MSTLGNAIVFLQDFGLFDVILPFLLVFTLVFAVLEKTKIFGVEGDKKDTRKNLNAMVAFSIAFFVVASVNVVSAFQVALPWVSLVLVIMVSFLLLSGVMFEQKDKDSIFSLFKEHPALTKWLTGIILVVVLFIFGQAFGWTDMLFSYFQGDNSTMVTSIIFVLLLVAAMWYAVGKKGTTT